ncbi:hypothetical protein [Mucilaginibacter flavidus]|uniref:hypothetical protein n=1 Tax=Mucilaginibacter flavidus TaxID=2949309 RepID=UPI00209377BE|nr:hypothetical protein [Mucilaginibacter flavidus]MCO5950854.1 hypothetical protein [Mucilaginibacter flavidus]
MKPNFKPLFTCFIILLSTCLIVKAQLIPSAKLETKKVMNGSKLISAEVGDSLALNNYSFKAWHRIGLSADESFTFYSLKTELTSRPVVVVIDKAIIKKRNLKTGDTRYVAFGHNEFDHDLTYKLVLFYRRNILYVVQIFEYIKGQSTTMFMYS